MNHEHETRAIVDLLTDLTAFLNEAVLNDDPLGISRYTTLLYSQADLAAMHFARWHGAPGDLAHDPAPSIWQDLLGDQPHEVHWHNVYGDLIRAGRIASARTFESLMEAGHIIDNPSQEDDQ